MLQPLPTSSPCPNFQGSLHSHISCKELSVPGDPWHQDTREILDLVGKAYSPPFSTENPEPGANSPSPHNCPNPEDPVLPILHKTKTPREPRPLSFLRKSFNIGTCGRQVHKKSCTPGKSGIPSSWGPQLTEAAPPAYLRSLYLWPPNFRGPTTSESPLCSLPKIS